MLCFHIMFSFLCAFEYSRKTPLTFHMSVRPSVRLFACIIAATTGFPWNLILGTSWKSVKKSKFWLKSGRIIGHCTWRPKYVLLFLATLNLHESALWLKWCQDVRASIYPHVSAPLPLDGFTWNLMLETSMEICQGKFRIWLKSGTLHEDLSMFCCCRRH